MARTPNGRVAMRLGIASAVMLGLSFAAVPLYSLFCQVTGYGGTTSIADAPTGDALSQTVLVRFDANVAPGQEMQFRPVQRTLEVKIGQEALVFYEAYNPTDKPLGGQAGFNVAPFSMGTYFDKIACFCFESQVLQPGERVDMPVSFFIDAAMLDDFEAKDVRQVTLSYTMFAAEVPIETVAADPVTFAPVGNPNGLTTAPRALKN